MKRSLLGVCLGFMWLVMCACTAGPKITDLTGVWKFGTYSGGHLDKIMIVGKGKSNVNRIQYEKHFSRALEKRNIEAVPSYTVIPEVKDLSMENMRKAVHTAGVKAVLASKVVGIDEEEVIFRQTESDQYILTSRGMYLTVYAFQVPHTGKSTRVRIETGLFDVESEKLIWAATSAVMNPDSADEAIKDFSKAIIEQLVKDGYIR